MKDVYCLEKAYGVDRSKRAALIILDKLQHAASAEAFQCLCRLWFLPALHLMQRMSDPAPDLIGKGFQFPTARPYE